LLPEADIVVSGERHERACKTGNAKRNMAKILGAATRLVLKPRSDIGWRPHHEHAWGKLEVKK